MPLGAHVSISGGVFKAPKRGAEIGCSAIQIFTKNQRQWNAKLLLPEDIALFKSELNKYAIHSVIAHDSYLINLGSPDKDILEKSRASFADEMQRAEALDISFLVFHPGAHNNSGEKIAFQNIAESLNMLLNKFHHYKLMLLLETTAGQGSSIGCRFEQLAEIIDMIEQQHRVGICFDTAHVFAAGYDLRTKDEYEKTFRKFDHIIGLDKIKAFHLNDSKKELASKVDRHEQIGKGFIGLDAFSYIVNDTRFSKIPKILEIPGDEIDFKNNLDLLKSLSVD